MSDKATLRRLLRELNESNPSAGIIEVQIINLFDSCRNEYQPKVRAVLDAAMKWESKSPEPDKDWDQIIIDLEDAVRTYKEESKDV